MTPLRAVLAGTGISVPPRQIDNHQLAQILDTNDEWIRERSGVLTRHFVEAGTSSADLGAAAAQEALNAAGIRAAEVDYLICATLSPDHYFPGSGTLIQTRLGMAPTPCLELRQQCAGFAYGMQVVDALIRSGVARTILLVGADVHTSLMPFSARTWAILNGEDPGPLPSADRDWNSRFRNLLVLFGDAAGAMVFRAAPDQERGILGSRLYGDGEHKDILLLPGLGSACRPFVDPAMIERGDAFPYMDGKAVFKLAVRQMPRATLEVLTACGYTLDDLDLLVMHQANLRINEATQKALGLPDAKVHNNIQKYGNTTSATLPLCFYEAQQAGKAPPGALVAFTALGAGMHYGSVLMRI